MIKIKSVEIINYKSFKSSQIFEVDPSITTLVGMNESGKTGVLELIAKTNYFNNENNPFLFDPTFDFPRSIVNISNKGEQEVARITFTISEQLFNKINKELHSTPFEDEEFTIHYLFNNFSYVSLPKISLSSYLDGISRKFNLSPLDRLMFVSENIDIENLDSLINEKSPENLKKAVKYIQNELFDTKHYENWDFIDRVIYDRFIVNNLPKFWYFNDYLTLPDKINITKLKKILDSTSNNNHQQVIDAQTEIEFAFLKLANISIDEIIYDHNSEEMISKLESFNIYLSNNFSNYWSSLKNIDFECKISTDSGNGDLILGIRVKNRGEQVSLPLSQRSKGFIWFFSFYIWFGMMEENDNFILLLDEPGLSLHAEAQKNLLRFMEDDLSKKYQIIYSTHSPFLIDSEKLHRIRTVIESDNGSIIEKSIQKKNSKSSLPLQVALGYNIAQNLFVAENNLLVEGVSDLIYLNTMSNILKNNGKIGLNEKVIIIPVGGIDKIASCISFMYGNELNFVAAVDTPDNSSRQKLENLIKNNLIQKNQLLYFSELVEDKKKADIEDMFTTEEYLKFYNKAFQDQPITSLNDRKTTIVSRINELLPTNKFNHYLPSIASAEMDLTINNFSDETIDKFEKLFIRINSVLFNSEDIQIVESK